MRLGTGQLSVAWTHYNSYLYTNWISLNSAKTWKRMPYCIIVYVPTSKIHVFTNISRMYIINAAESVTKELVWPLMATRVPWWLRGYTILTITFGALGGGPVWVWICLLSTKLTCSIIISSFKRFLLFIPLFMCPMQILGRRNSQGKGW